MMPDLSAGDAKLRIQIRNYSTGGDLECTPEIQCEKMRVTIDLASQGGY